MKVILTIIIVIFTVGCSSTKSKVPFNGTYKLDTEYEINKYPEDTRYENQESDLKNLEIEITIDYPNFNLYHWKGGIKTKNKDIQKSEIISINDHFFNVRSKSGDTTLITPFFYDEKNKTLYGRTSKFIKRQKITNGSN